MNLKLPDWAEKHLEKMYEVGKLNLKMNVYNESLLRMKAAPLLTKIATSMKDKKDGSLKPKDRKMFMYVGHDSTVVALLDALKVWNMKIPFYSSMVMVELHEDPKGWNVQVKINDIKNC